ncbi:competence/damage-inducible protein A [candidate division GN15 bacterium]|uniref:CinA-like protein n=1 Tax=candidate division GN15 bacterium TaxID=2072418 RepID=A0A855X345_9BACT|nr:MAG: competence/damage-inducible protein A [candidate division GN15 bacterium]
MEIEIITVGDEILTGHTVDTNAAFIAQQLTEAGFIVRHQSSVGDTVEQMEEEFRLAWKRSQIVIVTGGLGPTDDDLTKRAIVKLFKRNLVYHEEILEQIKERYRLRGIEMPAINQNQALLPQGGRFFPNKHGSAVGICIAEEGKIFIALPGVPMEMKQIMADEVMPYLRSLKTGHTLAIRKIRTTGIIESKIAEIVSAHLKLDFGVRLAYLPSLRGVDLRVMATGGTDAEALDKARAVERQLDEVCAKYIYGKDNETLEGVVGRLLADEQKWLSVAESCTGGLLGSTLTSVPGASAYFRGGVLAYANEVKTAQLGVSEKILTTHGAVSEQCAKAMAIGTRKLFDTDYALAVTGIAGPDGGTDDKPVGLVYIGLADRKTGFARKFQFGAGRDAIRLRAVYAAMELLRREILQIS